jgi:hypothetical protein
MYPSNCSGADAILDDCSVFSFFDGEPLGASLMLGIDVVL